MKRDEEGVHSIANTDNPQRVADIVFVHGLQGSAHSTWTYGTQGAEDYFFWPEELGVKFQQCGIWTVGYSAGVTEFGSPGMLIAKRALNLVSQFGLKGIGERPVIFICHSMGGLIIKELVVSGALPSDQKHSSLVKNTRGILFCGTPHRGSALATLGTLFGVAQKHVKQMKSNEESLNLVHERFILWNKKNPIHIETFAESHPIRRQKWYGGFLPRLMVVPRTSANPDIGRIHDVDADHLSLVKPTRESFVFEQSIRYVTTIIETLPGSPCSIPDTQPLPPGASATEANYSALNSIYIEFNTEKESDLKEIQSKLSEGHFALAEKSVRDWMAKTTSWNVLRTSVKAKAYRLLIQAVINRQMKTTDAKILLSQAKAECPDQRFVTIEALMAITDGTESEMLETYPTPVTIEEWRWKLLLFINNDQYAEAIQAAKDPAAPFPLSDSIQGCLTWAYIAIKELGEAAKSNEIALKEQPNSLGNLEAKALIAYANSISPHSVHWLESAYPLPIESECIYTTPEARQHLAEAAKIFESLSLRMDTGSVKQIRYLTWCLAAWCNLARSSLEERDQTAKKAITVFRQIQDHQHVFHIAIHWALLARLPLDLKSIENSLLNKAAECNQEDAEMLCQIYLYQGKEAEAAELLDQCKALYQGYEANRVWRYYRAQIAGSLGQQQVIENILKEAEDKEEELQLRALSLRGPARRGNAREECLNAYTALWQHTKKITDLYTACELHVGFDASAFVLEHANILLNALPTLRTLRLIAAAFNNTQHWLDCLDVLNKHREMLTNAMHALDFQSMECEALFQTGQYPQALALAKQIARENPSEDHTASWFDKACKAGNSAHMIEAAQSAILNEKTPPEHLLHMAEQLGPVHSELALQLFRTASKLPAFKTPHIAAFAFVLASRMGVTDELDPSIFQAAVSPGGPMRSYTFEQTIEWMQEHQRSRAEDNEKYRMGQVYVHAFANSVGYPISAIFHDACPPAHEEYFAAPSRLWSARIRHGRRTRFMTPAPSGPWKLHLDVTSLLLAHRLGVLALLEKTDAQISISPRLAGLLLEEIKRLNERQPSREKEVEHLLALVDAGKIRVTSQSQNELPGIDSWASGMTQNWRKAFSAAVESQGILIDFWPLDWDFDHRRPLEVPTTWENNVGGPSGLLQGMIEAGWIEESEIRMKIQNNSTFVPPSPIIRLTHETTVVLDAEIARALIGIGALDALVSSCRLWITYEEEQRCRESQRQAKYQDEIISSVDSLQKHVHGESGRRFQAGPASNSKDQRPKDSLLFQSLLDFTAASRDEKVILVADDRWLTGFLHIGTAPIVGLLDVLFWLYKEQTITASIFFGCLHRLRLGNARYVPLCEEEILFRLKSATNLHTRQLQETHELEVIRRYYAACYLDAKSLKMGATIGAEDSELPFLSQIFQVAASTLAHVWLHEENTEIKEAKAQWLLHALVTDVASLTSQTLNPKAKINIKEVAIADLFCLFCCSCVDDQQPEKLTKCAGSFAAWIIRALRLDPSIYSHFFDSVRRITNDFRAAHPEKEITKASRKFATRILMGLLPEGESYLPFDEAEKNQFGMIDTIGVGDVSFERGEAWNAISQALNGITTTIHSTQENKDSAYKVFLDPDKQTNPCVVFDDGSGAPIKLEMDLLHLLSPDLTERKAFLESKRTELDLSPECASVLFNSLVEINDARDRIYEYEKLSEDSTTWQFRQFMSQRRGSMVHFSHIEAGASPLGCLSLLRHAGMESGDISKGSVAGIFAARAPRLIEDYGLLEAFVRQASLPVKLPGIWSERLLALPEADLIEFVERFEVVTANPLIKLQLACILLGPESKYKERGGELLRHLIGKEARDAWSFFRVVLQWSWRSLSMHSDGYSPAEVIFCAWLHAGIFQYWLPRPAHSSKLIETFQQLEQGSSRLFHSQSIFLDVAQPLYFSARGLLAHALPKLVSIESLPVDFRKEIIESYRAMVFPQEEAPLPAGSIMEYREGWANTLGSFLAPSSWEDLNGWILDDEKQLIVQESLKNELQVLCENKENARLPKAWFFLTAALHIQAVPKALQDAVQIQLEAFAFSEVQVIEARIVYVIARFIFVQRVWYRTNDDDYWMKHFDAFLSMLERLEDKMFAEYALELAFIMNSAWGSDPVECAKRFADTLIQVVRKRASVATETWMAMSTLVQSQSQDIQPFLWPMLAEVRALAARKGGHP